MKRFISVVVAVCVMIGIFMVFTGVSSTEKDFIKYAEFNVCYDALEKALEYDIQSHKSDDKIKLDWIQVLAYLGAKYGGDFTQYKEKDMEEVVERLKNGEKIEDICAKMKYYDYYNQVYDAVLGGFTGWYTEEKNNEIIENESNTEESSTKKNSSQSVTENSSISDENSENTTKASEDNSNTDIKKDYGLCVFSPIAKTFPFSHYDDFGTGRTYGYTRRHLGHDLMAATGTPVIAIETGIVEVMGWNQYGGWRIGIRSLDKKRYYYYAHLRQNRPFHPDIAEGKTVNAGQVIGYVGRTGYSATENTNNIDTSHLHLGLELIFDESQKECDNEIWVNLYAITKLLEKHKSEVYRVSETKEFYSVNRFTRLEKKVDDSKK